MKKENAMRANDHPLYSTWKNMKSRCNNPHKDDYHYYGARGISVCPEWQESFSQFAKDMGPKPDPSWTLDRIDNAGDYEPGNCRWATKSEQQRNRRGRLVGSDVRPKPKKQGKRFGVPLSPNGKLQCWKMRKTASEVYKACIKRH